MLARKFCQIDRRGNQECGQSPHPFASFNTTLADMAFAEQLIQSFKVFDIRGKVVQEHHIKKDSHDLSQGGFFVIRGFFLMFETFAASPDRKYSLRAQADDWTEWLLKAHTTIAEKRRSPRRFESYWLKDQRNRCRRTNVVSRDFRCQRDPPASVPHGVALHSLNEEVAFARVVVRR